MNCLNSIILEGVVTNNPELKETVSGGAYCLVNISVSRKCKGLDGNYIDDEVSYFDIEAFGNLAEFCASKIKQDKEIGLAGRLKQSKWKNSDNKECSKVVIVAEHIELKPMKKEGAK